MNTELNFKKVGECPCGTTFYDDWDWRDGYSCSSCGSILFGDKFKNDLTAKNVKEEE